LKQTDIVGKVQTVLGPIDADSLGVTLFHEHLLSSMAAWYEEPAEASEKGMAHQPVSMENLHWVRTHRPSNLDNGQLSDKQLAIEEALQFKLAGGETIVEVSSIGLSRDPAGLQHIARATGLHIVMGAGYYIGASHPPELKTRTEDDIAGEIIRDITVGVGDTGVQAGIIGEIGCSRPLQEGERKVLRASAMAQRQTGAPLMIHPAFDDNITLEIVGILDDAGADLSHTVICHVNVYAFKPETCRKIADAGCYLGYESFGNLGYPHMLQGRLLEHRCDLDYIDNIAGLVADGYLDNILISHDICFKDFLTAYGGNGYAHILRNVLPVMRFQGFSEEQIQALMVENPKRFMQFTHSGG
jgi:phosphotriesterase-related protein